MKNDLPTYKYNIDEEHEDIDTIDSVRDSWVSGSDKYKIAFAIATTIAILLLILTILSFTVFNKSSDQGMEGSDETPTVEPSTVTITQSAQHSPQNDEPIVSTVTETQVVTETITETQRREVIINGGNDIPNVQQDNIPPNYIGNDVSTDDSDQTEPRN